MKTIINLFLFALLTSCNNSVEPKPEDAKVSRSTEMRQEIDDLLAQDTKNKKLELEYLEQIRVAQENNDTDAFEFFLEEYIKVERLEIPEELKSEPNYMEGGLKVKY
jgi:hypothetical protein